MEEGLYLLAIALTENSYFLVIFIRNLFSYVLIYANISHKYLIIIFILRNLSMIESKYLSM